MGPIEGVRKHFHREITELLILSQLAESDQYGFQLAEEIRKQTEKMFDLDAMSFYGPIYRLQSYKCVKEYTVSVSTSEKRNYYSLTPKGREYFHLLLDEYKRTNHQVAQLLDLIEREE